MESTTLSNASSVYYSLGENQKALEYLKLALPLMKAIGDRHQEATTLSDIGVVYWTLGENQKALEYYSQALPLTKAVGNRHQEATTLNNIGTVYQKLGENQKALEYYNLALPLMKAVGDRRGEAGTLQNVALHYQELGENQKAFEYYNLALPLMKAVGDRRGEAATLHNIGLVYYLLGENQKALEYFNLALPLTKAVGDRRGEASTFSVIGAVYGALGENQKALGYFNLALPLRKAVGDRSGEASTLNETGMIYQSLGENQKALEHFNQALPLMKTVGDRRGEATALINIGWVYHSLGENQKALEYYDLALPLTKAIGNRNAEAGTLNNIGLVYQSLGENQKALSYHNQALDLSRLVGARRLQSSALYRIAKSQQSLGNLDEAFANLQTAIDIREPLRAGVASPELRTSDFVSLRGFYDFYIELLMRLDRLHPGQGHSAAAFEASERARARTLLELLSEARSDIRQGVEPALLDRERSLRQLLDTKSERQTRLLSSKHSQQQADDAKKEIDQLLTQYQELQSQIRTSNPRYASLTQPQPLGLKQIQQQVLDADTLLLEYALGEDHSYLWAVTADSVKTYELPMRAEIEKAAQRVYDLLTARNSREPKETAGQRQARIAQAEAQYEKAASELSRMILGPVAAHPGKKRLVIVGDGKLNYVPFAALPVVRGQGSGVGGQGSKKNRSLTPDSRPLITDHEIINLPSASALAALRRQIAGRKPAPKVVALIADPVFDGDDDRVRLAARDNKPEQQPKAEQVASSESFARMDLERSAKELGLTAEGGFPRLPFTRREAEAIYSIAQQKDAIKALDFEANKPTAIGPQMKDFRIVHFATHGLLNNEQPELSGLVFSLVDRQGKPQNGFVRLFDVYNLELNAELVVLSACQTALGKPMKGEGLVGLTRGFMYAGAARVMASLWKVDDEASSELMKKFYEGMLKEGQTPATALRSAQIWMQKQRRWKSPYYWAGFVLQGEWR